MLLCVFVLFNLTVFTLDASAVAIKNDLLCSDNSRECKTSTSISINNDEEYLNRVNNTDRLRSQRLPRQSGTCVLPLQPDNGMYEVTNVPDAHPGQSFDYVVLTVSCRRGYGVMQPADGAEEAILNKVYCINGKWSQSIPKCVRFCKLEPDPSIRYMCHVKGTNGFRTCDKYVEPGTSVSPVCNSPIYYSTETFLYMKCIAGTWNYVAKCKAECGRVTPEGTQLIIDGRQAKRGELPWHAGIYRKTTTPYVQVCGGSLVSNNVVISAAHCFWSDIKKLLPASDYAVSIGKLYRHWDDPNDFDAQKSDVKEILIPRLFEGAAANFQEDIAILILADSIAYKTYIRPVCLNFDTNFDRWQLQVGKFGKVAGWGLTSVNGRESSILKVAEVPYINTYVCINSLPSSFREYITGDKFCAGYTNGTALCKGDSGGGLSFVDKELGIDRYYLRGIVSAAPKNDEKFCNDEAFTTFTKITKHTDFIKQSIASLVKKSCALSEFQCDSGACVDLDAECNGKKDCADGSDESDYLCKPEGSSNNAFNNNACILPPYPNHGTYKVANVPNPRPGQFLESFVLTVSCEEGYGIEDVDAKINDSNIQEVYCVNGAWYQIMPKCVRFCKVERDPSVRFVTCQVPGSGFNDNCKDYLPPGSTIIPTCNTPDYYSSQTLPFMNCFNGTWDYVAKCQSAFCKLDPEPNTRYTCGSAETNYFQPCGDYVTPGTIVKPTCDKTNNNYTVLPTMTCTLGEWNYVAKCKTDSCRLNPEPGIRYMCQDLETNDMKPCNKTVPVGTCVVPVCNTPYYYSPEPLRHMTCTDESWDYLPKCQADCGRPTILKLHASLDEDEDSCSDGENIIKRELMPWTVGIYLKSDLDTINGRGILVRSNIVITSAFDFYDTDIQQVNIITKKYVAMVRNSGFQDSNKHVQMTDITSIHVFNSYRAAEENYFGDIAVLILASPFTFNSYVRPVCLDFDINFEEEQLAAGNTGRFGFYGNLDEDHFTVIDINTCRNDMPSDLTRFIASDQICTTYPTSSGNLLSGSYGVGIFFPRNESGIIRYYVRGVQNDGCFSYDECNLNYAWSTRINQYKDFIERYL